MGRRHVGPGPGKYLLPSLMGYKDHDPSKYRYPAYTMGKKHLFSKKEFGPGPKYNTEYVTAHGKANPPSYSIASRPHEPRTFQGPGPAAYNVSDVPRMKEPRPPMYSMSSRHGTRKGYDTPGPNIYEIPTTIGPKVPDKHVNGAFSMSGRYNTTTAEQSPGPARYETTPPDKYKNRPPTYSIAGRTEPPRDTSTLPSPSDYYPKLPEKGGFSFGLKLDTDPYITAADEMPCTNK